jgi:nicotinate phosphoribosyltransferase
LVFDKNFITVLKSEFNKLNNLSLTDEECEWAITNISYIPRHYWEWLKTFKFNSNKINVWLDNENHLNIEVTDVIYKVTMYEIPILAIVSEVFYKTNNIKLTDINEELITPLRKKISISKENNFTFAEFGMRRRFSHSVEDKVCEILSKECPNCAGTSTVYFAKKYGLKPIGTMGHECIMLTASYTSPLEANYIVMENWSKVYDGNLGTFLTDTYTSDEFLRQFSRKLAKLYDGVRHDSGSPFVFGEKIIKKYESYGINPMSKTIIFSDALNFEKCAELKKYFENRINISFGIGTNLTNNFSGITPMNIVMKIKDFQINQRQPKYGCVKLSDDTSKAIGAKNDIFIYKSMLKL